MAEFAGSVVRLVVPSISRQVFPDRCLIVAILCSKFEKRSPLQQQTSLQQVSDREALSEFEDPTVWADWLAWVDRHGLRLNWAREGPGS